MKLLDKKEVASKLGVSETWVKRFMTTAQAAEYTGIPASTLRRFRHEASGPAYHKPAGRVLYDIADLDAFMESGRHIPSVRASKERNRHVAV